MGKGHAHALHHHGHSRVHHLAPEAKVAATLGMVVAMALTPAAAWPAFLAHALVLGGIVRIAELPLGFVLRRLLVVLPFVAFAFLVPFVGEGARVEVLGLSVSEEGLRASGTILAKALLGATASIVLTGTTEASKILVGLERLRLPAVLTAIAGFMLRYLEVVSAEVGRMRTAMTVRGHDPRWLWQARPLATGAGALFVRSYERGERVHAAMSARGFTGTMPDLDERRATAADWRPCLAVVTVAATITTIALVAA